MKGTGNYAAIINYAARRLNPIYLKRVQIKLQQGLWSAAPSDTAGLASPSPAPFQGANRALHDSGGFATG